MVHQIIYLFGALPKKPILPHSGKLIETYNFITLTLAKV